MAMVNENPQNWECFVKWLRLQPNDAFVNFRKNIWLNYGHDLTKKCVNGRTISKYFEDSSIHPLEYINFAFLWDTTSQGRHYWFTLYREYGKYYHQTHKDYQIEQMICD